MYKGQTSRRGGVQDVLCPFPYLGITQYSRTGSHLGTSALDIGWHEDEHESYYAPCDLKCVWVYSDFGQSMWQSVEKVRFTNGNIDYITFVTAHDNSLNAQVGQVVKQGEQWGNKGDKGAKGQFHCHIEAGIGRYTYNDWHMNHYNIYCMPNEIDLDSVFFCDGTEVPSDVIGDWKCLQDVPVNVPTAGKKLYLPSNVDTWRVYPLDVRPVVGNECGFLLPSKFDGLEYNIVDYSMNNVAIIDTRDFGRVQIYIEPETGAVIK